MYAENIKIKQVIANQLVIIYTPYEIYSSGSKYQITRICYSAAKENPELLRSNVKMVIGIIVRLLRDRASVDSSPASKRAIIKKLIKIIGIKTDRGCKLFSIFLVSTCI
ncbi:hypothetical protein RhiirA5_354867 [Rhizophagus irregularis]|uniref:Uncharacterized protein n=2 Tax=Rhizophagus irregularis TaxID=588596 RepID=A0A2I1E252_9GLOM|nr:hypothetical protein RhiirA5_354867 [Rhizophagus irregularis]PKY16200.1 hypothetical protein RhiirB3_402632 [Rhizophagus irregularis]